MRHEEVWEIWISFPPLSISHVRRSTGPSQGGKRLSAAAPAWLPLSATSVRPSVCSKIRPAPGVLRSIRSAFGMTREHMKHRCNCAFCDDANSGTPGPALCTRFPFVIRNIFSSQNMVYQSQWLSATWFWVKLALGRHDGIGPDGERYSSGWFFSKVKGLHLECKEAWTFCLHMGYWQCQRAD